MDFPISARARSPFRKLCLVPIWCTELFFLPINVVTLGLLVGIEKNSPADVVGGSSYTGVQIWTILSLPIALTSLIIVCLELVLYSMNDLSPVLFLYFSIAKISMWTIPVALDVSAVFTKWAKEKFNGIYLYVGMGLVGAVYFAFFLSLIYSLAVWKADRRRMKGFAQQFGMGDRSHFKD